MKLAVVCNSTFYLFYGCGLNKLRLYKCNYSYTGLTSGAGTRHYSTHLSWMVSMDYNGNPASQ
jgi:hypothetical protein